jgi:hypothetical protein
MTRDFTTGLRVLRRILGGDPLGSHGAQWKEFAAATSSVPFLAIAQRRQWLVVAEIGWWRLALSAPVFLIALYGHHRAFGVSPLPRILPETAAATLSSIHSVLWSLCNCWIWWRWLWISRC